MDKFVSLDAKDKRAYFEVAAANLNIMPQLVEKDFWVCWILKALFSLPQAGEHLIFKGGTSLSKCYNVIKRFSEDIDISIERPFLSRAKTIEPDKEKSSKENQKRLKELQTVCKTKIDEIILPSLKQAIEAAIPNKKEWKIELHEEDPDGQTLLFTFPHSMMNALKNDYRQMQQMFFEEPPTFEKIMEKLQALEKEINRMGKC